MNHNVYPTRHLATLDKHPEEKIIKVEGGYVLVSDWHYEKLVRKKRRKAA